MLYKNPRCRAAQVSLSSHFSMFRCSWKIQSRIKSLTYYVQMLLYALISLSGSSFTNETYEVVDVQYLPLIGSLSIVFANGRAGVIMATTNRFSPGEVKGVWIMDVTKATCTAVNHRYRLIAYGLSDSEGVVYYLDEVTVTFVLSHKLMLSDKDFPGWLRTGTRTCIICLSFFFY